MGYRYDTKFSSNKEKSLNLDITEQIRSLQMILYDKPYTFVKRSNFMKKARGKLNWFNSNYTYFVNQRWCFDHSNVKALYNSLDKESRKKYNFDVNEIDFNNYACEAALVCFNKYINYRNNKKKGQVKVEQDLKNRLEYLIKEEQQNAPKHQKSSLSKDERLQILQVLRQLFFMVGLDAKVSFCIFFGLSTVAMFTFFIF